MPKIILTDLNKTIFVPAGTLLLPALRRAGLAPEAPCGGQGSCGKCRVSILTPEGPRLEKACQYHVTEDLRLLSLPLSSPLPDTPQKEDSCPKPDAPALPPFVLAFDLGTTSLVSRLLESRTGRQLAVSSAPNPQAAYGADLVSRCSFALEGGLSTLTEQIRRALSDLALENAGKACVSPQDIHFAALAGNTCMQRLLLGQSPASLVQPPYSPRGEEMQLLPASSLGLSLHPQAQAMVFPTIGGFVGGDTVSVLLSLPADAFSHLTLVLDVGTNGELVLGRGNELLACSAAAGPALEGASITCGMRAAPGAIDHVSLKDGLLTCSVIGNVPALGICGSGLLDLTACLLDLGILSPGGLLKSTEDWPSQTRARYGGQLSEKDGIRVFLLPGSRLYLTQKDIRELQLAKAAIAAAIELLCRQMDVSPREISQVLLAGAFGSLLSPESACRTGLIPEELLPRIRPIGNAAGEGAGLAALYPAARTRCRELAGAARHLNLAASPDFQETFLRHLSF